MAATTTALLRSPTLPLMIKLFNGEFKNYKPEYSQVYDAVQGIRRSVHNEPVISDLQAAVLKPQGTPYTEDTGNEAYTAAYIYQVFGIQWSATQELLEDGEEEQIGSTYSKAIARAIMDNHEIVHADFLNRGFLPLASGGSTVGDGVPLFSAAHANIAGPNNSNLGTPAQLSEASLEQMLIQISGFRSQKGNIRRIDAQKLIVPKELEYVAERILNSALRPGTNNNDINAVRSLQKVPGGVVVMRRLTSQTAYFMKTDAPQGLQTIWRSKNEVQPAMIDPYTGNEMFRARTRYACGATNYSGVYGNAGL